MKNTAKLSRRAAPPRNPANAARAFALILSASLGASTIASPRAETAAGFDPDQGTYLSARLAQDLRDNEAADVRLKAALARDPGNASLLEQAFFTEVMGGNWQKAVGYAARTVAADPGNQLAHMVLGVDAFRAGRFADADKHFAVPGNSPVAVMARAWALNGKGDEKGAAAQLASLNSANWIGVFRRVLGAEMADVNGETDAASKAYDDLFAADPSAFSLALAYARHASHSGDNKKAADILGRHLAAVQQHHPFIDAAVDAVARDDKLPLDAATNSDGLALTLFSFAQASYGEGAIDLAMMYVQFALQLRPNDQLFLSTLAEVLEQQKKFDDAIAVYKKIPPDSPLFFGASLRAGLDLNALDKPDDAKKTLLGVLDGPPAATPSRDELRATIEALGNLSLKDHGEKVAQLQELLGKAGVQDGKPDGAYGEETQKAVMALQDAAGLSKTGQVNAATRKALEDKLASASASAPAGKLPLGQQIDLYSTLGRMLSGRKEYIDAADYLTKAIDLIGTPSKANWDQFYSRAVCYERLNQWDKAEPDFLKALDLNPDEPLLLNYLGYSWVDRNQHIDKAVELIKKAVSLKPDDGYYVDSLGWAYFRMGRYEEAVTQLEHAVELDAGDPTINDHLGDAYWRAGRKLEAQFQWSTALTYKPEPEDKPRIEAKLKDGLPDAPAQGPSASATPEVNKGAQPVEPPKQP